MREHFFVAHRPQKPYSNRDLVELQSGTAGWLPWTRNRTNPPQPEEMGSKNLRRK